MGKNFLIPISGLHGTKIGREAEREILFGKKKKTVPEEAQKVIEVIDWRIGFYVDMFKAGRFLLPEAKQQEIEQMNEMLLALPYKISLILNEVGKNIPKETWQYVKSLQFVRDCSHGRRPLKDIVILLNQFS